MDMEIGVSQEEYLNEKEAKWKQNTNKIWHRSRRASPWKKVVANERADFKGWNIVRSFLFLSYYYQKCIYPLIVINYETELVQIKK